MVSEVSLLWRNITSTAVHILQTYALNKSFIAKKPSQLRFRTTCKSMQFFPASFYASICFLLLFIGNFHLLSTFNLMKSTQVQTLN